MSFEELAAGVLGERRAGKYQALIYSRISIGAARRPQFSTPAKPGGRVSRLRRRLSDLAEQAKMTPQALGDHVDELERLGYLERIPDPGDRRAKLIRPTAKGLALFEFARRSLGEIEAEWADAIGARRVSDLHRTLAEIRALQQRR